MSNAGAHANDRKFVQGDDPPAAAVLTLAGDVDSASVGAFGVEAQRLLDIDGLQRLVVDLGQVGFMDSSGLGLLVRIRKECVEGGIDLLLAQLTASTRTLLDIAGLRNAFHIEDAPPR